MKDEATAVVSARVSKAVKDYVRLEARTGGSESKVAGRLLEESVRRRHFPRVDLRQGVAFLAGTRFTVCWVVGMVPGQMKPETFAAEYELPPEVVREALAYADAYPEEIAADKAHVAANGQWIAGRDAAGKGKASG